MSLFRKATEHQAPKGGGGMAVLRGRAKAQARSPQGQSLMKEALHVSSSEMDAFLSGGDLSLSKVGLLLDYLGITADYLPDLDLLRSKAKPATSIGGGPPQAPIRSPDEVAAFFGAPTRP